MKLLKTTILVMICAFQNLNAQPDSTKTIKQTGEYTVGVINYEFTDYSRTLSFAPNEGRPRTIGIQLWYPAKNISEYPKAPYSALSGDYRHVSTNSYLRAPLKEEIKNSPLILIVPGRGVEKYGYTSIAEELVSYGYTVISIDMPEIGYIIYQDGYIVKPNSAYSPGNLMRGPYEKVDKFFELAVETGVEDIEFALNEIQKIASKGFNGNFLRNIDFENIGIFSHSLGGRIGGAYADKNKSVRAYLSMEGIPPREIRFRGMNIPQAHMVSSGTYPYAKENYKSITDNVKEDTYLIILDKLGHNSVTDFPLITPSRFSYTITPHIGLEISREITLLFFNQYLNHRMDEKLEDYKNELVRIHFVR